MRSELMLLLVFFGRLSTLCSAEGEPAFFLPVHADSETELRGKFNISNGAIPFQKFTYRNLEFICVTPVRGGAAGIKDIVVYMQRSNTKSWSLVLLRRTISTTVNITIKDGLLEFKDSQGQALVSMQLDSEILTK